MGQVGEERRPPIEYAAQAVEKDIGAKRQAQNGVRNYRVGSFPAGNSFQVARCANGLAHRSSSEFSDRAASAPKDHWFLMASGLERDNFDSVVGRKTFYTTRASLA